jgi:YD repeat-containing protein
MQPISGSSYMAADASGYRIDWMPGFDVKNPNHQGSILTDAEGVRYYTYPYDTPPNPWILAEDPNGNQITRTSDTMGRDFSQPLCFPVGLSGPYPQGICGSTTDYSQCAGPLPIAGAALWNLPGVDGGVYPIKFCFVLVPETNPGGFLESEICGNGCTQTDITIPPLPTTAIQLQSVVLPNGQTWILNYTSDGFGNLSQITMPTGGTISYNWLTLSSIHTNSLPSYALLMPFAIQTRTVSPADGTSPSGTWTYDYLRCENCGQPGTGTLANINAWLTVVTDPAQNDTGHFFSLFNGTTPTSGGDPVETLTNSYNGSIANNQILKSVQTDYKVLLQLEDEFPSATIVPIRTTTTLDNGLQTKTEQDWDNGVPIVWPGYDANGKYTPLPCPSGSGTSLVACGTVLYGAVVAKREYDYGNGAPGPLLRTTTTPHLAFQNPAYLNNNLLDLVSSTTVTDGNGQVASSATYAYDGVAPAPSGISIQHDPNPPGGAALGNLTATSEVVTTAANSCNGNTASSTTQATAVTWFDTGMVAKHIDALGNATTYSYSPTYAGGFPTTVCNALNQCTNSTYDPSFGFVTSATDANGQITQYSHDNMGRVTNIRQPAQIVNGSAINGGSSVIYNDVPPVSIQLTTRQDSTTSITSVKLFDGLARPIGSQLSDPQGNIITSTTYDSFGRVSTVSNPYRSTSDPTYGITQTLYDVLGRPAVVVRPDGSTGLTTYVGRATQVQDEGNGSMRLTRIAQLDGLGRLASVCEVTGDTQVNQNSPAACGQDIAGTGFLTSYHYDILGNLTAVNQGNLNRSFVFDSFSRLVNATNPESGTTCYKYDSNGNILSRTRPAPNQGNPTNTVTANYTYDPLNRLTKVSYSDSVTPSVAFHYDTSSELGVPLDNTIGRLSASYMTSPSGQLLSGKVYSYDPLGHVIDNSQCTPLNCGAPAVFPLQYSYDLLGKLLTGTNGVGTALAYSYDSAGYLASITSSLADTKHPATILYGATYSASGALKSATLGGALTEAFDYDCRNRLTSYASAPLPGPAVPAASNTPGCPSTAAALESGFSGALGPWHPIKRLLPLRAASSILISRSYSSSVGGESLSIKISSANDTARSELITVAYESGDTAVAVAQKCAARINENRALHITATVKAIGTSAIIDLLGPDASSGSSFFVAVSVASRLSIPSITATSSGPSRWMPVLSGELEFARMFSVSDTPQTTQAVEGEAR